jgi:hypothetical protein
MKKAMLYLFLGLFGPFGYGQSSAAFDKVAVIAEARGQLTTLSAENGDLAGFCREKNITGEFVFDLTLQGKGKILTIFLVSSTVEDVSQQNLFKAKLSEVEFGNIKIPKNERVKFRHTLTF